MKEVKIKTLIAAALSVILALAFFVSGWKKIFGTGDMGPQFIEWGYEENFATLIGVMEIAGAVLAVIPKTSSLGGLILVGIMAGAFYTHVATQIGNPAFAVLLGALALVLVVLRWDDFFISGLFRRSK